MTQPDAIARFLYEVGHLKHTPRSGWLLAGIDHPESVAEHSFRTAVIGYVLASLEGADPALTAAICLFHDLAETRLGDLPSVGKHYVSQQPAEDVSQDQLRGVPTPLATRVLSLVSDYSQQGSAEAQLAKDADKLECLLQAREYQAQGNPDVEPWITTSAASIRSPSGKNLAAACQQVSPGEWWRAFVGTYVQVKPRAVPDL